MTPLLTPISIPEIMYDPSRPDRIKGTTKTISIIISPGRWKNCLQTEEASNFFTKLRIPSYSTAANGICQRSRTRTIHLLTSSTLLDRVHCNSNLPAKLKSLRFRVGGVCQILGHIQGVPRIPTNSWFADLFEVRASLHFICSPSSPCLEL